MSGKTILFHDNSLTLRGTSIALYNYADYNEKILGGKSIILSKPDDIINQAKDKFTSRFETYFGWYSDSSLDSMMVEHKADYFYSIRAGNSNDGSVTRQFPSLIHAVFRVNDPHGSKYAYVSDWLAINQGYDPATYSVPHIVEPLPQAPYDLREKLGIPKNKLVFGCYGGSTEFNISWVHEIISRIVKERSDIIFLFMNINIFCEPHPNIIHLPGTYVLEEKSAFVNACDAMLHARAVGETFGLACAEFSMCNKPVITYELSSEANHIYVLKERGIYYKDYNALYKILNNFHQYAIYNDYDQIYKIFSPEIIMNKFQQVFLS
jgi:glycosyltransferase involved in cell wall biosynthesis